MADLKTIQEIFNSKIFRIPDYQRGYSWNVKQLDAFWQDLENLQKWKNHYTGTITIEDVVSDQFSKWEEDKWIIEGRNFKPYYIVDGQQRISTVVILLFVIADSLSEDEEIAYMTKSQIISKYIFQQNERQSLKSYIFGYEVDNPSFEFLKTRIFGQNSSESYSHQETIYTNNLLFAKNFFVKKIEKFSRSEKEELFKKVSQRLKFDFNEIDKELDIFVVFETMNNRGKPLSNLELLKNRLIYLATISQSTDDERIKLRKEINNVWKTIYEFLGKNIKNELDDDEFLRIHWVMYYRHDKEAEFDKKDIFERIFTVKNIISDENGFSKIQDYIQSIQKSVIEWYKIKNPTHALLQANTNLHLDVEIVTWLEKLNRIGFTMFEPLTLAIFSKNYSKSIVVEYLQKVEDYIFTVFLFSRKRRDTGGNTIYQVANQVFKNKPSLSNEILPKIEELCYSHYDLDNFKKHINQELENGFYDWSGIKYFLHEYEEYLRGKNENKVDWNMDKTRSIEHIYPQTNPNIDGYWNKKMLKFQEDERKKICHSLGNLVLLSKSKNSEMQNNSFESKKQYEDKKGVKTGYFNGSCSEIEISLYDDWDAQTILERGMKMLAFLGKRWNMDLGNEKDKKQVLMLEFLKLK